MAAFSEKLTTRMTQENKMLLEKALVLSGGLSLNSFITNAAIDKAKKLIQQEENIYLNREDSIRFLDALEHQKPVTQKFIEAVRIHKELIGNADSKNE